MKKEEKIGSDVLVGSRRDFLKGAALIGVSTLGAGLLTACNDDAAAVSGNEELAPGGVESWDYEADVVVVGYGGAGAATAITAHDAGAKVIILEKMPEGGGNTAVSGGGFLCPNDAGQAYTYITKLFDFSNSVMDGEIVKVFSDESVKNVEWLQSLKEGTEVRIYGHAGYGKVEGADSQDKYQVVVSSGTAAAGLFGVYTYAVEEDRGIEVLTETSATALVVDSSGAVIGVKASNNGQDVTVKAKRAVVLTTGGYEYDDEMKRNYIKGTPVFALGNPGNTGDGVRLAQKVGADLWHMNGCSCPIGIKVDDLDYGFQMMPSMPGYIWVDSTAKRFVDEADVETHAGLLALDWYNTKALGYPRIPAFMIFDEAGRTAGPISGAFSFGFAGKEYAWSSDNSAEIEKGWIIAADTVEDLAGKLGIDPATFAETVAKWNADIKAGEDTLFERAVTAEASTAYLSQTATVKSAPIETAPYYAVKLYPTLLNTQGGPRRNARAQILDAFGAPIPRLYSSGELGCMWGLIYQGAGNNSEAMVFGRIAGTNAAAETPWDA
ncbi:MAG: FAD-binding protein [Coriobacteriales bacterium]|jgi:succinate dehydrogenase/fumarate reductase flavoprotein subunit|nr:FAD-binding protein [Coriobacteriales bacterium]